MPEWARAVIKWVVALFAMVLVVAFAVPRALDELSQAVTFGDDDVTALPEPSPTPVEEPETAGGEAVSTGSVRVTDGVVSNVGLSTAGLTGPGQDLLLAFDPIPTDPACITTLELVLVVDEVSADPDVLLRPAVLDDFDGLAQGDSLPADAIVDLDEPVSVEVPGDAGTISFDADEVYALAAREGPEDGPVVLALAFDPDETGDVMFVTAPGAETSPTLRYEEVADCPEGGATET